MQKTGGTNHTAFQFGHFSSLVWSRLVWYLWSDLKWKKSFTYGFDHLDAVNNHFLVCKAIWAWWQPNERTNNQVILEQACSCPVKRQFFAIEMMVMRMISQLQIRPLSIHQQPCCIHTTRIFFCYAFSLDPEERMRMINGDLNENKNEIFYFKEVPLV